MNLKDLAAKSGVTTTQPEPDTLVANAKAATKTRAPKAPKEPKAPKAPKEPKAQVVRHAVDDAWIQHLTEYANAQLGNKPEYNDATIAFTVAKSKGRPVSMTPKLVFPAGTIKSAGPQNRIGFCTNKDYETWIAKLKTCLDVAMTSTANPTGVRRTSKKWRNWAEALGTIENVEVKTVGGKISASGDKSKITFKSTESGVEVSAASGSIEFIVECLQKVRGLVAPEPTPADEPEADEPETEEDNTSEVGETDVTETPEA